MTFSRELLFGKASVQWKFSVCNRGATPLPFLHVMHALFPLDQVQSISLPDAGSIYDEAKDADFDEPGGSDLAEYLCTVPADEAHMLLLRDIQIGRLSVLFKHGIRLHLSWSSDSFPTLGIWWNNRGYPEGEACRRRCECAFEPIAGSSSSLGRAFETGRSQLVGAGSLSEWVVEWQVETERESR